MYSSCDGYNNSDSYDDGHEDDHYGDYLDDHGKFPITGPTDPPPTLKV